MNRQGHNNKNFFIGKEVEHTPAIGKKTLFVIGLQSAEDINNILNDPYTQVGGKIDHIFFGANHSFHPCSSEDWVNWDNLIQTFLRCKFWCTLDFDVTLAEYVAETRLVEYNTFIPMLSVKIPYVRLMNYNAVVKIDDKDFAATNPGVWCYRLHDLQKIECFTDWSKYSQDEVLK